MATLIIQIPNDDAEDIVLWAATHKVMMITSTVPRSQHWEFQTASLHVEFTEKAG